MSLFELVATGPQAGQRWRQTLSAGHRIRIGRAPAKGWAVSWDMRISREHFDVELESEQLKVKCLDSALNPAHVAGQSAREFTISEGESFRIGATNFHFGRQVPALDDDTSRPSMFPAPKAEPPAAAAPQMPKPPVVEQEPSGIRHLKDEVQQLKAQLAAEAQRRVVEEAKRISAEKEAERFAVEAEAKRLAAEAEARRAAEAEAKRIASEQEANRRAEELAQRIAAENEAKRLASEAESRRQAEEAKRLAAEAEAQRLANEAKSQQVAQADEDMRRPGEETRAISSDRETKLLIAEAEAQRLEEEANQRAAEADAKRLVEEAEARRIAEEEAKRKVAEAEAKRLAEEAEARRIAEAKRLVEEAEARRMAEEEAKRLAEEAEARRIAEEEAKRLAEEAEARRIAEAKRLVEEAEARRIAEEEAKRLAEEAEARRMAEEEAKRLAEEAEARRIAEEKRLAEEAEARRMAEEEAKRLAEEAEARRIAQEKRLAEEAEARRIAEEEAKRKAEEAEAKRLAEEAEARRIAEEKRLAEEAEARRIAEEKEAKRKAKELADRIAAEKREAKRLADEAETRRLAEEAKRMAAEAQRLAEAAEARRLALEAEAQREVEEEAQRLAAEEEEERRAAEEADDKRRAEQAAKLVAAEEDERFAAEEAITKRRSEARRIAEEEEKQAEEEAQAKRAADAAEAKRQADEEVIRIALEEEAARRAAAAQVNVTVGEADIGGLADQLEQERAKEAEQRQQAEQAARKAAEAAPPRPPPRKPNVAELKAQLAAEAAAKRQAKEALPAPSAGQAERPGESPQPAVKGELQNLKAQLASQAAAKKQERAAAAPAPPAPTKDPVNKKLDLGALKAELEAKKAAKQNKGSDVVPPLGVGQASEDKYVDRLAAQLNAPSVTGSDLQTSTIKPSPRPAELSAQVAKSLQAGKGPLAAKPAGSGKPAAKAKEVAAASGDDPKKFVWQRLPEGVRESVRKIASGKEATPEDKLQITQALNQLAKDREFLAAKALEKSFENARVADGIKSFPKGLKGIKKDWSELEVRAGASLVLQSLYLTTRTKKRKRKVGLPRTLAYLSRSDIFGEIGALLNQPRSATCIAYDHPQDDPSRKPGRVELVRIGIEVFHELLDSSPGFRAKMETLIAERQHRSRQAVEERPWDQNSSLKSLPEFQQLGLVQGQELMLIDLDRCTRCGDCVRACINTHDDGYSRLFLDGPRFDRFLVPSACRKCLNPSCMIGCPVGSIQRGDNDEIVIRDWCIGCSLCARQCPYDSIQMHDLGIVPEKAIGWRFQLASNVTQQNWNQPSFRESNWSSGTTPFAWDLNLQIPLSGQTTTFLGPTLEEGVYFRYQFDVPKDKQRSASRYRLFLVSNGSGAEVWVNGQAVELPQDAKQRKKGEYEGNLPASLIRSGKNVVAVSIQPSISFGQTVLSLRLDMPPELTGDAALANELKLVTERAVVCDMCSSRPGGEPACVTECPHDAAMRVDAQHDFPRN